MGNWEVRSLLSTSTQCCQWSRSLWFFLKAPGKGTSRTCLNVEVLVHQVRATLVVGEAYDFFKGIWEVYLTNSSKSSDRGNSRSPSAWNNGSRSDPSSVTQRILKNLISKFLDRRLSLLCHGWEGKYCRRAERGPTFWPCSHYLSLAPCASVPSSTGQGWRPNPVSRKCCGQGQFSMIQVATSFFWCSVHDFLREPTWFFWMWFPLQMRC